MTDGTGTPEDTPVESHLRSSPELVGHASDPGNRDEAGDGLPKPRSGQRLRRLPGNTSHGEEPGDTTTYRDPSVPGGIPRQVRGD